MAVFVDTGAWVAYFVRRDLDHATAVKWMKQNRQILVTTDYIQDELLTLLKLRENYRVAVAAGEALRHRQVARLEHITEEDIERAWNIFQQYHDKEWSLQMRSQSPVSKSNTIPLITPCTGARTGPRPPPHSPRP